MNFYFIMLNHGLKRLLETKVGGYNMKMNVIELTGGKRVVYFFGGERNVFVQTLPKLCSIYRAASASNNGKGSLASGTGAVECTPAMRLEIMISHFHHLQLTPGSN